MISKLEITGHAGQQTTFTVQCGKGTYIRALARDIGRAIGSAAHVVFLERRAVGRFKIENAIDLDFFEKTVYDPRAYDYVIPVMTVLDDIPALPINEKEARDIRMGRAVNITAHVVDVKLSESYGAEQVLVLSDNHPVALGKLEEGRFQPVRVFNLSDIN